MNGKNLQRICRHSPKCSKTGLKSGSTIDMFITVTVLVGMWKNNIPNKCSEPGGNFVIFEVILAKKVL